MTEEKKGIFARILEKMDKDLEKKSKKTGCCCCEGPCEPEKGDDE